jgi:hypothetical protein
MPLMPRSLEDFKWFYTIIFKIFRAPLWTAWQPLSMVLFIAGCVLLWRKERYVFLLLLSPIFIHLIASGLKKYPFGDQLLMYSIQNLWIPIVVFFAWLWSHRHRLPWLKVVVILLVIANVAEPTVNALKHLVLPRKHEELRQVLSYVHEHSTPDDTLFLFRTSRFAFFYYRDRFGLDKHELIISEVSDPTNLHMIPIDMAKLYKRPRVWLLFGHGWKQSGINIELAIVDRARKVGRQIDKFKDVGAAAYLFDFSQDKTLGPRKK